MNKKSSVSRARGITPSPARSRPQSNRLSVSGHDPLLSRRSTTSITLPRSQISNSVRVEQLSDNDGITGNACGDQPCKDAKAERKFDHLQLPDTEANESSDGSSMMSPHSEDGQSAGDEAIAVDCHTNPSEVIVKGKNVKQIRVKFPPHPPPSEDGPRKMSARGRLQRSQSGSSTRESLTNNEEKLPYPCEETSLPAITESSNESQSLYARQESCISLHSHDLPYNQINGGSAAPSSRNPNIDWDRKYKEDILAGLDYFERKGSELNDLNSRALVEMERIRKKNDELEEQVYKLKKENEILADDMSELKIKLDQAEKENHIVQNQAVTQWQERVGIEERFVEMQRDTTHEINLLKEKLNEREKEVTILKSANNAEMKNQSLRQKQNEGLLKESRKPTLSDDNFELLHKISQLQEEIKKLNSDKDGLVDKNGRLRQDMADLKTELDKKSHDLESQYRRFLALKRSYNDLDEEHKKLKIQLRGRSMSQHHIAPMPQREQTSAANTTWPSSIPVQSINKTSALNTVELENVSYIDLPKGQQTGKTGVGHLKQVRGSQSSNKTGKSKHSRSKSEAVSDNLPPVPNPSR